MTKYKVKAKANKKGKVRIIAGRWRGRILTLQDRKGLRPSPARLRETLFNWLSPYIANSYCWDLCAGSGALGIEAKSRGAAKVALIENNQATVQHLQAQIQLLSDPQLKVYLTDAQHWLSQQTQAADIVFLDPPFGQNLIQPICQILDQQQLIKPNGWLYIETPSYETDPITTYPCHWLLHRQQQIGQVRSQLLQIPPNK